MSTFKRNCHCGYLLVWKCTRRGMRDSESSPTAIFAIQHRTRVLTTQIHYILTPRLICTAFSCVYLQVQTQKGFISIPFPQCIKQNARIQGMLPKLLPTYPRLLVPTKRDSRVPEIRGAVDLDNNIPDSVVRKQKKKIAHPTRPRFDRMRDPYRTTHVLRKDMTGKSILRVVRCIDHFCEGYCLNNFSQEGKKIENLVQC